MDRETPEDGAPGYLHYLRRSLLLTIMSKKMSLKFVFVVLAVLLGTFSAFSSDVYVVSAQVVLEGRPNRTIHKTQMDVRAGVPFSLTTEDCNSAAGTTNRFELVGTLLQTSQGKFQFSLRKIKLNGGGISSDIGTPFSIELGKEIDFNDVFLPAVYDFHIRITKK
jgi:hypothetical protein